MSKWSKITSLSDTSNFETEEVWIHERFNGTKKNYPMRIFNGKDFDFTKLNHTNLKKIKKYSEFLCKKTSQIYQKKEYKKHKLKCPCCNINTKTNILKTLKFIGITYNICKGCGHCYIADQPSQHSFDHMFEYSSEHSEAYTQESEINFRINEIIIPKLRWCLSIYEKIYGKNLFSGLDVGAGGGHFVKGMKDFGINAHGFELSISSRKFAKEMFNVELISKDFLKSKSQKFDLVTMWGLLEYTSSPSKYLLQAKKFLNNDGLLIIEVPRINCLGTSVQISNPFSISRHMDPTSHINAFSDESLATLLVNSGYRPVAAWYFGMDIYEMLIQFGLRLNQDEIFKKISNMIPDMQRCLDNGRQCDDIVIASVPEKN